MAATLNPAIGITRRCLLQAGAITLGGLSQADILRLRAAQTPDARCDTAVILLWMTGGPSHIDTYDMKPSATADIRGPFQPIATNLPGLDVCELLPRHATLGDRLTIIRSFRHAYGVHDDAQHLVQTGWPQLNARQAGQSHPCQGSVASLLKGSVSPGMPPYVCVPEDYRSHMGFYQSAAFLGGRHNALNSGGDPSLGKYRPSEFELPPDVTADRLGERRHLLRSLEPTSPAASSIAGELNESRQQAFELLLGSRVNDALDLAQETDAARDRYGRHAWGQYALIARRLVEAGVTFVTVNLYEKDVDWWDDHYTIEKNLRRRLPIYDAAFSALIEDLTERGLSERVLVVACGEFGRAPRIDANAGRGHWPRVMQAVLSGGGIRGGQIIGATTDDGGDPSDRVLDPGDLLASIYEVLGISHDTMIPDRLGRPVRLAERGIPIAELFA